METPLFSALMQHIKSTPLSLHVPGHKNGTVFMEEAKQFYQDVLPLDVTELTGLDDLHDPKEAIAKAQQLAAVLYQVQETYFLVNGSTVGNLAMILACCNEGDEVLVQRNSHKSIINGIYLAGARPIFLSPKVDEVYQVPAYVELETVKEAIQCYPKAKALILTNPNYYGLSIDLTEFITFAHTYNIPVLVDEAHGAHYIAGEQFPVSSIEAGADIVVHSAHKSLPAMTMGSYLHLNSKLIDKEKLQFYLALLQSSSPSYPIMASLDLARAYLEKVMKEEKLPDILKSIETVMQQVDAMEEIEIVRSMDKLVSTDPLKLTIRSTHHVTGFELQTFFESQGIYAELADPTNVLFMLPLHDNLSATTKLKVINKRFPKVSYSINKKQHIRIEDHQTNNIQPLEVSYSYLKGCEKKVVAFEEAIGFYSAESIIPYPPGIPFLMIGEKLTADLLLQLRGLMKSGVKIQGDHHIQQGKITIYVKSR